VAAELATNPQARLERNVERKNTLRNDTAKPPTWGLTRSIAPNILKRYRPETSMSTGFPLLVEIAPRSTIPLCQTVTI
jgi:hypothetical protein